MKIPLFVYKGIEYSYVMVDGEPIPYKTHMKMYDEYVLDDEMQKELDIQIKAYENSLNAQELEAWRGES